MGGGLRMSSILRRARLQHGNEEPPAIGSADEPIRQREFIAELPGEPHSAFPCRPPLADASVSAYGFSTRRRPQPFSVFMKLSPLALSYGLPRRLIEPVRPWAASSAR